MKVIDTIICEDYACMIILIPPHSEAFEVVTSIRSQSGVGAFSDEHDQTADIYLMVREDTPVATMRVNQARKGRLDCEEFYPGEFLTRHRHMIGSASRLARSPATKPSVYLMRHFVRSVWQHQLRHGMRVDLINVHQRMIPYYADMGYRLLYNSFFWHPRIHTPSHVMFMVASRNAHSPLADICAPADDPLLQELVTKNVPICWNPACLIRPLEEMLMRPRFTRQYKEKIT